MPTMRSAFTIEQFEEALQKLAHKFPRFKTVRTEDITIVFRYDEEDKPYRIRVQFHKRTGRKDKWGYEDREYWGFTVERKVYATSSHSTKISFGGSGTMQGQPDPDKEKIQKWLEKVMSGEKVIPRFTLKSFGHQARLGETKIPEEAEGNAALAYLDKDDKAGKREAFKET